MNELELNVASSDTRPDKLLDMTTKYESGVFSQAKTVDEYYIKIAQKMCDLRERNKTKSVASACPCGKIHSVPRRTEDLFKGLPSTTLSVPVPPQAPPKAAPLVVALVSPPEETVTLTKSQFEGLFQEAFLKAKTLNKQRIEAMAARSAATWPNARTPIASQKLTVATGTNSVRKTTSAPASTPGIEKLCGSAETLRRRLVEATEGLTQSVENDMRLCIANTVCKDLIEFLSTRQEPEKQSH